jgi:hypothetical protein
LCYVFCFVYRREEWAAINIRHNTQHDDKQNKIHNTNKENRWDNQEWAAVNIGHNTLKENKQKYTTPT